MKKHIGLFVLLILTSSSSFATENNSIGKTVYDNACAACHAPKYSKAIRAPAAFDKTAWANRLSGAKKKSGSAAATGPSAGGAGASAGGAGASGPLALRNQIASALKGNPEQVKQMFANWVEETE